MKAPLPLREQPLTQIRVGSMFALGVVSKASIIQDTAQTQAAVAPVLIELLYRLKNRPVPGDALFCCAAIPSLSKVTCVILAGIGMLTPPIPIMARYGAVPLAGVVTCSEKVIDFPPLETMTVSLPAANEPVTLEGFDGLVPSSYFWNSWLISCWRQGHCAFIAALVPLSRVKGSGCSLSVLKLKSDGRINSILMDS